MYIKYWIYIALSRTAYVSVDTKLNKSEINFVLYTGGKSLIYGVYFCIKRQFRMKKNAFRNRLQGRVYIDTVPSCEGMEKINFS